MSRIGRRLLSNRLMSASRLPPPIINMILYPGSLNGKPVDEGMAAPSLEAGAQRSVYNSPR